MKIIFNILEKKFVITFLKLQFLSFAVAGYLLQTQEFDLNANESFLCLNTDIGG